MSKPKQVVAPMYPWCQTVLATKAPAKTPSIAPRHHEPRPHPLGTLAPAMPKKAEVMPTPTHLRRQFHARKNTTPLKTETHSTAFATQPPSLASCSLPTSPELTR